ncbi:hypothetical protein IWQ60_004885 [Tieghemiomyces parasiticus]|uniref:Coilin tudor domain-containing protein n=1 Tax=Tieghemiomyces parasiticus TaxID=78921 RepID=A0A9W8ADE9_9FUNG|nr:hypothetical protein IWQ60_004885 [Tieghemiomyces parasiticus]
MPPSLARTKIRSLRRTQRARLLAALQRCLTRKSPVDTTRIHLHFQDTGVPVETVTPAPPVPREWYEQPSSSPVASDVFLDAVSSPGPGSPGLDQPGGIFITRREHGDAVDPTWRTRSRRPPPAHQQKYPVVLAYERQHGAPTSEARSTAEFEAMPSLNRAPCRGDTLAFKMVTLASDLVPTVSDWQVARVTAADATEVTLQFPTGTLDPNVMTLRPENLLDPRRLPS